LGRVGIITLPTTFLLQICGKSRSFLIDVVVPRKVREVYGLLVIGNGALKLNLVTGSGSAAGYLIAIGIRMALQLPGYPHDS
jgi:hypothetical protein